MATTDLADVKAALEPLIGDLSVEASSDRRFDAVVRAERNRFVVEVRRDARAQPVAHAILQLEGLRNDPQWAGYSPLIFVDYMGSSGRALCERHCINWADSAGNAEIAGDGLIVRVQGRRRTAPSGPRTNFNPYGRNASRVAHALLLHPHEDLSQQEIAIATGLPKGTVSRALSALADLGFVEIATKNRHIVHVAAWEALLDSWLERYRAPRPLAAGLVTARSGAEVLEAVTSGLMRQSISYAVSGLAAAAFYTQFGSYRRVLIYVDALPQAAQERFHLSDDMRGRNIIFRHWDPNAGLGATKVGSFVFSSPFLTLMDLASEPERAEEASEAVRQVVRSMWR